MPAISIPDDFPAVMSLSAAYRKLVEQHAVAYHDTLPGSEENLIARIAGAEAVINIRSSSKFTASVFAACPNLKVLSLWGTGTDNVDLAAATRHGVTVTNTPGVAAVSIAEHSLALLMAVARKIPSTDAAVRQGTWPRGASVQLNGKTLGIIGLGAIGRQFAKLGAGIGMKVICWTMNPRPELGFTLVDLDTLYRESDVVSLHLRLSDKTQRFVGPDQFAMMKPSAIFINTARGAIVDQDAMVEALRTRCIAGAGLDVFETEPLPPGDPVTTLDNVVLSPHSAGITPEVLEAGLALSIENMWSYFAGSPVNVVNRDVTTVT